MLLEPTLFDNAGDGADLTSPIVFGVDVARLKTPR
jgi:hypothetical protein